jgi:hypothetical protein
VHIIDIDSDHIHRNERDIHALLQAADFLQDVVLADELVSALRAARQRHSVTAVSEAVGQPRGNSSHQDADNTPQALFRRALSTAPSRLREGLDIERVSADARRSILVQVCLRPKVGVDLA